MDNDRRKLRDNKAIQKIKRTIQKDGFYMVLFICICFVAASAAWVSQNNLEIGKNIENTKEEKAEEIDLNLKESKENQQENLKGTEEDIQKNEIQNNQKTQEKANIAKNTQQNEISNQQIKNNSTDHKDSSVEASNLENNNNVVMNAPLMGKVIKNYAIDKLIYSKTLEQWTTHKGIDIEGKVDTPVKASLDGVIKEVKKDDGLGIVITIDHGNGLVTKYGNLSTDEMVKVGQNVKKGDVISGIGEGAGFEVAEGPHLHFEVIKNGKNVDPKSYVPVLK